MSTPNPFVPQGSLLEYNKRRSRMKLAVSCVVVAGAAGLVTMLIQGCQRHEEAPQPPLEETNTLPPLETNLPPLETNVPPVTAPPVSTNVTAPPPVTPVAPVAPAIPAVPPPSGTEYVVVQGDTLSKIAKSHGVSLSALEAANPGVDPRRLKVGQKLTLPPANAAAPAEGSAANNSINVGGQEIYVVKSGDTLTRIARHYGTTVKAIQAANNLATTRIKVGQKLKIPTAATAAPASVPSVAPAPASSNAAPLPGDMSNGQ
jgi:LysM repeat protein